MVPSHGWCVLCRSPETGTPGMKVGNTAYNGGRGAGGGQKAGVFRRQTLQEAREKTRVAEPIGRERPQLRPSNRK